MTINAHPAARYFSSSFIQLHPMVAVGLKSERLAIILEYLRRWIIEMEQRPHVYENNFKQGHYWYAHSYEQWEKTLPWLNRRQIQAAMLELENLRIVISAQLEDNKWDKRKWYRIDMDALWELMQRTETEMQTRTNSCTSNEQDDESSNVQKTVPSEVQKTVHILELESEPQKEHSVPAFAGTGQQGANHAAPTMESDAAENAAPANAPAEEPIPLEENTSPDEAPMPESQAPAESLVPLEEAKPIGEGAPEKKARKLTPAQLRSNALLTALGTAPEMATKAEGKRAGQVAGELNTIYKRARSEDMTPEDVTAFVEYVKKQAGGQWTVTANSLLMNGRFAGWMEARAKAAAKPAPVASSAAYDELMSLRGA